MRCYLSKHLNGEWKGSIWLSGRRISELMEEQVQRPWGGHVPGMLGKQQGCQRDHVGKQRGEGKEIRSEVMESWSQRAS